MHTASVYRTGKTPARPKNARRLSVWYALLIIIFIVFVMRLFYLQVLRHDFYQKVALSGQLKQYDIPAERGVIRAHDGDQIVPLVLNEQRFNLIADPKLVKDSVKTASSIATITNGNSEDIRKQVINNTRYEILGRKLSKEQKEQVTALKLPGIFLEPVSVRTYPQNELAAQLLGFVNDEAEGKYGVEQALDTKLAGTPGRLKAITDQKGVPLLATGDNTLIDPVDGQDVVLTIDLGMQRQLEDILKQGLDAAKSKSGSVVIMDPNTGAVKAVANYPTYNPAEFYKVEDASVFTNAAVSAPLEVGSIMKPLTAAAALDLGVINKNTTYYDPSHFKVDDATVTNIEEDGGAGTRSIADILQLSLNTGATWLLMQMGGGTINQKARVSWNDYMVNHYQFGKKTGIEQGYEAGGYVASPTEGFGLNIQYANMAFGQGMLATPLQMAAALSSVVNGGTYYKPHLVDRTVTPEGKETVTPKTVVRANVVSKQVGEDIQGFMEYVVIKNNITAIRKGYNVGGKTGTAQIAKTGGGYFDNKFNGTYMGFVGGKEPAYVIVVRVNEPAIAGYAGSQAAAPIFSSVSNMLINNFNIPPM
jgi:stage V sporulation protein D (sporulation-specific penicillin-binding protein)